MTDRISATMAVIEAAKEWNENVSPMAVDKLMRALDATASAESPDLDAKIAEALSCNCVGYHGDSNELLHKPTCHASRGPAVRDLIVSLLVREMEQAEYNRIHAELKGERTGFEQAREQAAKLCEDQAAIFLSPEYATEQPLSSISERFACGQCAEAIRSLTPDTERTG